MTAPQLKKATQVRLRDIGLDEKWLQDRIHDDPSLLPLGRELVVLQREKKQAPGGRIDFLMFDDDAEIHYVVELMLGSTDGSHIIRTIEYWDIERQRNPTKDYRAVLVAEEITARFFNVIRLLNRAAPLIAIQMAALQVDGAVVLHFTKVLDISEEMGGVEEEAVERADRRYWEELASKDSLAAADRLIQLVNSTGSEPRITYNRGRISVATTGQNFLLLRPRKQVSSCHVNLRVGDENREAASSKLSSVGIGSTSRGKTWIRIGLTVDQIEKNKPVLADLVKLAEERSKVKGALETDEE